MSIIWFLLIGLIAGWLAGVLVQGRGYGVVVDIVLGVVGSMLGGFLFSILGISAYGTLGNIVMALIGAILVIGIVKAIHKTA